MDCQHHRKVHWQRNQIHIVHLQNGPSEQKQPPQLHRWHTKHRRDCQNGKRSNSHCLLRTCFQEEHGQHWRQTWYDFGFEEQKSPHSQVGENKSSKQDRTKTNHMGWELHYLGQHRPENQNERHRVLLELLDCQL